MVKHQLPLKKVLYGVYSHTVCYVCDTTSLPEPGAGSEEESVETATSRDLTPTGVACTPTEQPAQHQAQEIQ